MGSNSNIIHHIHKLVLLKHIMVNRQQHQNQNSAMISTCITTVHTQAAVMATEYFSSVQFNCSVVSNSLWPHELPRIRLPCPSLSPVCLLKLMSIELVMPSNHHILYCPLLFLPSIFPIIRVFSNESVLLTKWPKYWSSNFSIIRSSEYSGLISAWQQAPPDYFLLEQNGNHPFSTTEVYFCSVYFAHISRNLTTFQMNIVDTYFSEEKPSPNLSCLGVLQWNQLAKIKQKRHFSSYTDSSNSTFCFSIYLIIKQKKIFWKKK